MMYILTGNIDVANQGKDGIDTLNSSFMQDLKRKLEDFSNNHYEIEGDDYIEILKNAHTAGRSAKMYNLYNQVNTQRRDVPEPDFDRGVDVEIKL